MPQSSIFSRLGILAAALAVAAMLLSGVHVLSEHNGYVLAQAEAERHAQLTASAEAHGHSHDDGEGEERLPGHVHGHNTADHVHESAALVSFTQLRTPHFVRSVIRHEPQGRELGLRSGLDRPPRPFVA